MLLLLLMKNVRSAWKKAAPSKGCGTTCALFAGTTCSTRPVLVTNAHNALQAARACDPSPPSYAKTQCSGSVVPAYDSSGVLYHLCTVAQTLANQQASITSTTSSGICGGNWGGKFQSGWSRICCCVEAGVDEAASCPLHLSDCPAGSTYNNGVCTTPPIDGGYTAWGACSVACGGGTQTRSCSNPTPVGTGADCSGLGSASQACNPTACTGAPSTAPSTAPTMVPTTAPSTAPTMVPTTAPSTAPTMVPTNAPSTSAPTAAPSTSAPSSAPVVASANSAVAPEVDAGATVGIVFGIIGGLLVLVIVAVALAVIAFIVVKKKQQDATNKSSSISDEEDGAVDLSLEMGSMASAPTQKPTSRFVGGNPMSAKEDFGIGVDADDEIMGGAKIGDTTGSNPMQRAADFGIGGASLHSSDSLSLSDDENIEAPAAQQATTEKKSRPISMRADVDGTKYSKEQFVAHYGGSEGEWNQAKRTSHETAVSARPVSMRTSAVREESFTNALAGFGEDEGDGDNVEKKQARPVSMRTSMVREESFANALAGFGEEDDGDHAAVSTSQLAPVVEDEPMFAPPSGPPAAAAASGEAMFSFGGEDDSDLELELDGDHAEESSAAQLAPVVVDEVEPMFAPPPAPGPFPSATEEIMF